MRQTNRQRGFSLIELLIVVAIIGIIAAIAIPNMLASRRVANEAAAIAALRNIGSAQQIYIQKVGNNTNYAADLVALGPTGANLIDNVIGGAATSTKSGYEFTMTGGAGMFTANADPINAGATGARHFFTDASGVIRAETSAAATGTSSAIQ